MAIAFVGAAIQKHSHAANDQVWRCAEFLQLGLSSGRVSVGNPQVVGGLQLKRCRVMQSNIRAVILLRQLLAKSKLARKRMQSISSGAPQPISFGKCNCAVAARVFQLPNQADNAAFGDSGLHCRFRAALRLIRTLGPA
jgi:hypothetical protein